MKFTAGFLLLLLIGCTGSADKKIEHSFYYWKTTFSPDSTAALYIHKENITHFYIHYFDVNWDENNNMPVPVAEINGINYADPFIQTHFTPVIFITNRCFRFINESWCDSLAYKIKNRITFITNKFRAVNPNASIDEIQIDCDWTAGTHEKYFLFLKHLKALYPATDISATIRLYPYKYYEKTGVPPVDKGLLMCYNLTDIKDAGNTNSIFNLKDLQQYLVAKKYPLPLDVALPVFEWYAWFSKGKFKNIIYPGGNDTLTAGTGFFKRAENNYVLTRDTVIDNNYLREGDILRLEYPGKDELKDAVILLQANIPQVKRIAFFYWDKHLTDKNEEAIHHIFTTY